LRRRDFITFVGGAAVAWPLLAHAQQPKRRIGVLMSVAAEDREGQARYAAFVDGLRQLGLIEGRNLQIDTRWPVGDAARGRSAEELVGLVIVASGSANVTAL
jgi:putative ABC transport system substrate-binding protein